MFGVASLGAVALVATGCGGGQTQDAGVKKATYDVTVTSSFPAQQDLAEHTQMVVTVHNADRKTIPQVAVTVVNAEDGTSAEAFADRNNAVGLASASRPVWVIDKGPLSAGGKNKPTGGPTAYSNTWALGPVKPNHDAKFIWDVTSVKAGRHKVKMTVDASLTGRGKARVVDGGKSSRTFTVNVTSKPRKATVDDAGNVVYTP